MRPFILTIFLAALCSLSLNAARAQNSPPPPAAVAAPEECPEVKSVQTKAQVTKAATTMTVTRAQVQVQNPPPAPPARPTPQVNPVPKPGKPKVKVGEHDQDEDSDADEDADQEPAGPTEQTAPATSSVVVSFCGGSSNVIVRGWDRNEVHASVEGGESVELTTFGAGDQHAPASKSSSVSVMVAQGSGPSLELHSASSPQNPIQRSAKSFSQASILSRVAPIATPSKITPVGSLG